MRAIVSLVVMIILGSMFIRHSHAGDYQEALNWVRQNGRLQVDARQPGSPVVGVDLYHIGRTTVNDADMQRLAAFPHLRNLNIGFSSVTDEGLKQIANFKELENLDVCFTAVSDAGLSELKDLTSLQSISLQNTKVTDAGIKHLSGLKNLRRISMGSSGGITNRARATSSPWRRLSRYTFSVQP
ncbi:MAG: hypothetical protein U0892_18640 [Pirellulales bacterium]